jgi:hypothetical protein
MQVCIKDLFSQMEFKNKSAKSPGQKALEWMSLV